MGHDGSWRPLPVASSTQAPTLLACIELGPSDYTVRVTDMANLWVESLDMKAIKVRGWAENTTIDPSDSTENMSKLLSCLCAALEPSHEDHERTSMSLSRASLSDAGEGGLTVHITCDLSGLQPLKWPMHLRKASSTSMTSTLIVPLVEAQYARALEIRALTTILSKKDAVLNKLLDKLEATGTGLEHIFNQLSGKKKISRASAAEKIKGLAPFDWQQWKRGNDRQKEPPNTESLVREVFKEGNVKGCESLDNGESSRLDRWWLDLKGTLQVLQPGRAPDVQQQAPLSRTDHESLDEHSDDEKDGDDDFQVQETPPHLTSRSKSEKIVHTTTANSESTDSEDNELMASSSKASGSPAPQFVPKPPIGRMGAIGGKKSPPQKRAASPEPSTRIHQDEPDADTASDASGDDGNETASTVDPSPPSSPKKKAISSKGRMGQIGAKKSGLAKAETAQKDNNAIPSRPARLGVIGKAKNSRELEGTSEAGPDARGRQTFTNPPKAKEEPRETSTERADRRREELKKELEKKAAMGPAKKKRKF